MYTVTTCGSYDETWLLQCQCLFGEVMDLLLWITGHFGNLWCVMTPSRTLQLPLSNPPVPSSLWPFTELRVECPCLFCSEKPRTGHSSPSLPATALNKEEGSPLPSCWQHIPLNVTFPEATQWWLIFNFLSPGPFLQSCFPGRWSQRVLVPGVVPSRWQDFALQLVELHGAPVSPFLLPLQVTLAVTTLWSISHSFQFCTFCRLAEDAHCPIIQLVNEDVDQDQTQHWPLGCSGSHWSDASQWIAVGHPVFKLAIKMICLISIIYMWLHSIYE